VSEAPVTSNSAEGTSSSPERDRLAAENAELQDRYLRLRAEFDNFRRRADREKVEILEYASMEATRALLPILDDFERAAKMEIAPEGDPRIRDYAKGMELIQQRLRDTLVKLGLEPVEAQGKPFDPHFHQALQREETSDYPDGTVMSELQRGYLFKGRLLRPALVTVAVNHPSQDSKDSPNAEEPPKD
jgi:molecular chaperone GrpE